MQKHRLQAEQLESRQLLSITPFEAAMVALLEPSYPAPDLDTLAPTERAVYGLVDPTGIVLTPSEQWMQSLLEPGVTQLTFLTDFGLELLGLVDPSFVPEEPSTLSNREQEIERFRDAGLEPPKFGLAQDGPPIDGPSSQFAVALLSLLDDHVEMPDLSFLTGPQISLLNMVQPGLSTLTPSQELFVSLTLPGQTKLTFLTDFEMLLLIQVDDAFAPPEPSHLTNRELEIQRFERAGLEPPKFGLTTTVHPNSTGYLAPAGSDYDGVAYISLPGNIHLSGVLLPDGLHVASAAHAFTDGNGNPTFSSGVVTFHLPGGNEVIDVADVFVHPKWNGTATNGYDIAILVLDEVAPVAAQRYALNRTIDEISHVINRVGYGYSGTGTSGELPGSFPTGLKRTGENRYDAVGEQLNGPVFPDDPQDEDYVTPGTQLIFGFDNGDAADDALGVYLDIDDLGQDVNEVFSVQGDSGGPTFIEETVAGLFSWYYGPPLTDTLAGNNGSFGEIGSDTRIRTVAGWIDKAAGFQGTDTAGLFDPFDSKFYLRNTNSGGLADLQFEFGPPSSGWTPLSGDWDGNGIDTVGFYNAGAFLLKNAHAGGLPDLQFNFGAGTPGVIPISGDWDGDGIDTIGLYEPVNSAFFLRNSNSPGIADIIIQFGPASSGWAPFQGDWDGDDGIDTIGLYSPTDSTFYLRNELAGGAADIILQYGPPNSGWTPLAGDWDADATTTVGLYSPTNSTFLLRNSNSPGIADLVFQYGPSNSGWLPIIGDWDAASAQSTTSLGSRVNEPLAQDTLNEVVEAAIARWAGSGLDEALIAQISNVRVRVADLPGTALGNHSPGLIYIDEDAAGHGWYVDSTTPQDDEEFVASIDGVLQGNLDARMDLLSTVLHELGHELGLADSERAEVMRGTLEPNMRLLALDEVLDANSLVS